MPTARCSIWPGRRAPVATGDARVAPLWPALAEDWRRKQLEYSWLRTIMGAHADFAQVTADALDWALEVRGLHDSDLRAALLAAFRRLPCYAEVPAALDALRARGKTLAILSNGTPDMLAEAVETAGLSGRFQAVISVESAAAFKPDPRVYALVEAQTGVPPARVVFVSSNGWDVAGRPGSALSPHGSTAPPPRSTGCRMARPDHFRPDPTGIAGMTDAPGFFTAADGARLAYRDQGEGLPLLCLSGLTRTMADFDYPLPALAGCRVIRMDYRGRGASHWTGAATYTVPKEAQDALALLNHLGVTAGGGPRHLARGADRHVPWRRRQATGCWACA